MSSVAAVFGKIWDSTVEPIRKGFLYVFQFKDNVDNLNVQAQLLTTQRQMVHARVDAAQRNEEVILPIVDDWMRKADETMNGINHFHEDGGHKKSRCSGSQFPNLWTRYKLSKKAKKMAEAVADIQKIGENFGGNGIISLSRRSTWIDNENYLSQYKAFQSRESVLNEIMEALKDPNTNMVGVYGLPGVGKTTLVKEVARKVIEEKLFDEVAMVIVKPDPDLTRLLKELSEMLGMRLTQENTLAATDSVRNRLMQNGRFLVILDDVWDALEFRKIGIPLSNMCKVLMTSRSREVLEMQSFNDTMVTQKIFELQVLQAEEANNLFTRMTLLDTMEDNEIQYVAAEVVKVCAGLPLALVTLATALRNKSISEWRDALRKLKSPYTSSEMREPVHKLIEVSYGQLSTELQYILSISASLGDSISKRGLLKYCVGLSLFKDCFTIPEAEDRLETHITKLKAMCWLQDHDKSAGWFIMHDIVRDMALYIASKSEHAFIKRNEEMIEWQDEDELANCSSIILYNCNISQAPEFLPCPTTKLLYICDKNCTLKLPERFFEMMNGLKVLELEEMFFSSLPSSIAQLKNLQTLCLEQCVLEDIAMVGELKHLKILSLNFCDIKKLPIEIGQLTKLQLFDLTGCSKLEVIPYGLISKLKNLQVLLMGNSFFKWNGSIGSSNQQRNASLDELNHLPHLSHLDVRVLDHSIWPRELSLNKLERYMVLIGNLWSWYGWSKRRRTLKVRLHENCHVKQLADLLLKRVQDLYVDEWKGVTNVLGQLNAEGFPYLKNLNIQDNAEIHYIIESQRYTQVGAGAFPILESLSLHNLSNLNKISNNHLNAKSFSKLRIIKITSCGRLQGIFPLCLVQNLSQLIGIEVSHCNSLKEIVVGETENHQAEGCNLGKVELNKLQNLILQHLENLHCFHSDLMGIRSQFFNDKVAFPMLETLKLVAVNVGKIWPDISLASFWWQNLSKLTIESCPNINYLFSYHVARNLTKLKYIELDKCQMVEEIIHFPIESTSNFQAFSDSPSTSTVLFPNLDTIKISNMINLKSIWNDKIPHHSVWRPKAIEINHCGKIDIIVPSSQVGLLGSLETLEVKNCGSLRGIFEFNGNEIQGELDAVLKNMYLHELPELEYIWSRDPQGTFRFQNILEFQIYGCGKLKHILPFSIAKGVSKVKELIVGNCPKLEEIVLQEGDVHENIICNLSEVISYLAMTELPKLRSFHSGMANMHWPVLKKLELSYLDSNPHFAAFSSVFPMEEVLPNLEFLSVDKGWLETICHGQFPTDYSSNLKTLRLYNFRAEDAAMFFTLLKSIPAVEELEIGYCWFTRSLAINSEIEAHVDCKLKELRLWNLKNIETLSKEWFPLYPVLGRVKKLLIEDCHSLMKLVPSTLSFNSLTYLRVEGCNRVRSLLSSTTAMAFTHLKTLIVRNCKSIDHVVFDGHGEEPADEINFSKLELLELKDLPKLTSFCPLNCALQFPILKDLYAIRCPMLIKFSYRELSAPKLHSLQVEEAEDEWYWEGSLDSTFESLWVRYQGRIQSQVPEKDFSMYKAFQSRESILNEIMEALKDANTSMVGVYGLPGVGKTTLVKEVARKVIEEKSFDEVAMVIVNPDPDLTRLQKEISEMLGMQLTQESVLGATDSIRNRLMQNGRFLVILDDVWDVLDFGQIGIPLSNMFKVLMTSRNSEVLEMQNIKHRIVPQNNFHLQVLPKEEASMLFMEIALLDAPGANKEIKSVAAELVKVCAGLPTSLVTLATALRNKSIREWRDALRELKSPNTNSEMIRPLQKLIKLGFHQRSTDLQSIHSISHLRERIFEGINQKSDEQQM